ncbi:hypothetical protein ABTX80_32630 [Streptomyces erythrochromogenes]|uniref:hypothetical protein n=1 Tax=Streptomyces erythrochromogenes TaxID=285574 RepID=UPI003318040D
MQQPGEQDGTDTVATHLNRRTSETSWQEATCTALAGRLVDLEFFCRGGPSSVAPG